MTAAALLAAAAFAAWAGELGGHEPPAAEAARPAGEDRTAVLEELWSRRLLAPDQASWSPADRAALERLRAAEPEALEYLAKRFGRARPPWTALKRGEGLPRPFLTKEGYEKYLFHLSQDAIAYFEEKGAGAKWALKLTDAEGRRLFGRDGRLTEDGARVYALARRKAEVYWRSPDGRTFGTRRPR